MPYNPSSKIKVRPLPVMIAMTMLLFSTVGRAQQASTAGLSTPQGIRLLQNKTFDDSEKARREVLVLYKDLRVTDVCDGMDLIGLQDIGLMDNEIRPLWRDEENFTHRFVGFAITVRYVPSDVRIGQNSFPDVEGFKQFKEEQYRRASDNPWKETVKPGDVVVMDVGGIFECGNIGSNNSLGWVEEGIVGVITNGGARDTDEIVKVRKCLALKIR